MFGKDKLKELVSKLDQGIEVFTYLKSDGTIRKAIGTRSRDLVPEVLTDKLKKQIDVLVNAANHTVSILAEATDSNFVDTDPIATAGAILEDALKPFNPAPTKAKSSTPDSDWINYYDFEAKGWRKFNVGSLL